MPSLLRGPIFVKVHDFGFLGVEKSRAGVYSQQELLYGHLDKRPKHKQLKRIVVTRGPDFLFVGRSARDGASVVAVADVLSWAIK